MTQTTLIGKLLLGTLYTSIAVAILVTAMLVIPKGSLKEARVSLAGVEIMVTIADTPELREKGLSFHNPLLKNEGMLFVFPDAGLYGFWMKDMLFPIDIIWLDEKMRIVDVWENATPESYPKVYMPRSESKYVLEVNAGFYRKHALKSGDVVELRLQ
ncbi:MAG: hypothetical protein UW27_C0002G0071 [Parcubacteria group bacterium GW2011_GWA1_44_13]|uniref:DUF192 domain-containing protein n=1 Tax=Candidatus Nomurabacteria bacterium GW2011_GWB1_44_12 TaxID=1618748 RepID=A0A837I8F9_9BACT|nr:MAG: hypothetical protein UW17_C0014G0013 [Candidatus Nomurabacteria bacterium GW2011_GWD1_44_10]KKT37126.1 MAG: hypothetical protein UW25_C0002G0072 [Candidatus Nomurabacteria bacterium GW2011_GWB1_44_12]KKT38421.1 MAG: hypothetical protein UW27_C0002G0071 [Parcubacteria group bacterium GW2011_GWA1_44_13]KKT60752.1 MAG: hypothetical protein UW54_C0004G0014 [Parcubacteria group bacterium GW2011_GWC1_44_26]HBB43793.1 DUF192 domain-containing protein [Candidatus Yonathbacteria bacterium]